MVLEDIAEKADKYAEEKTWLSIQIQRMQKFITLFGRCQLIAGANMASRSTTKSPSRRRFIFDEPNIDGDYIVERLAIFALAMSRLRPNKVIRLLHALEFQNF